MKQPKTEEQKRWYAHGFKRGVVLAAGMAEEYAKQPSEYRLGDRIAMKLNQTTRKIPRRINLTK